MNRSEQPNPQFQIISLIGNLTHNPELRSINGGTDVGRLRLAVNRRRRDGEDQGADFIDVTVFGAQAKSCAQYLAKGRKVAVEGRLHHSEWDDENGRRQRLEVVARHVEFLRAPGDQPNDSDGAEAINAEEAAA